MQTNNPTLTYAASCNPPRKAKRLRAASDAADHVVNSPATYPTSAAPVKIRPAPMNSVPSVVTAGAVHRVQDAPASPPAPKRRGRRPANISRSARESQRKMNHSLIEKARRSKINDALAALRELVPSEYGTKRHADDDNDKNSAQGSKGKGKKEEKEREFKLEVLERTVLYMRHLIQKVQALDKGLCTQCGKATSSDQVNQSSSRGTKRRHDVVEEADVDDDLSDFTDDLEPSDSHPHSQSASEQLNYRSNHVHDRLPPISSWLDPSLYTNSTSSAPHSAITSPSSTPAFRPLDHGRNRDNFLHPRIQRNERSQLQQNQLPTPPPSSTIPSTTHVRVPPVLLLPSPPTPTALMPKSSPYLSAICGGSQVEIRGKNNGDHSKKSSSPPEPAGPELTLGLPLLNSNNNTPTPSTLSPHLDAQSRHAPSSPTSASASSTNRQPWTPEDESAASLLLHIRTSPVVGAVQFSSRSARAGSMSKSNSVHSPPTLSSSSISTNMDGVTRTSRSPSDCDLSVIPPLSRVSQVHTHTEDDPSISHTADNELMQDGTDSERLQRSGREVTSVVKGRYDIEPQTPASFLGIRTA
ncbi:hypothetical protein BD410DRAFT_894117 [Rickenella mellea]|uniref:BHLH domain-containing protein n=1 Tax=Rickenella mellea TaxID=50990 RepID=A0A4Y7QK04_9AGAM|nr:hypothetical protein BD410DRAFT_894117 [Rickenella mellea]